MSQYVPVLTAVLVLILCILMYFGYRQINKIQMENNQLKYDVESLKRIQRDMDVHHKTVMDAQIQYHLNKHRNESTVGGGRLSKEEAEADDEDEGSECFDETDDISAQESEDNENNENNEDNEEYDEDILNSLEENNEEEHNDSDSDEESESGSNLESESENSYDGLYANGPIDVGNDENNMNVEEKTEEEHQHDNVENTAEEEKLAETVSKIHEQMMESRNRKKGGVPSVPAKEYKEGTVLENDGKKYVVSANKNGLKRWRLLQ